MNLLKLIILLALVPTSVAGGAQECDDECVAVASKALEWVTNKTAEMEWIDPQRRLVDIGQLGGTPRPGRAPLSRQQLASIAGARGFQTMDRMEHPGVQACDRDGESALCREHTGITFLEVREPFVGSDSALITVRVFTIGGNFQDGYFYSTELILEKNAAGEWEVVGQGITFVS